MTTALAIPSVAAYARMSWHARNLAATRIQAEFARVATLEQAAILREAHAIFDDLLLEPAAITDARRRILEIAYNGAP